MINVWEPGVTEMYDDDGDGDGDKKEEETSDDDDWWQVWEPGRWSNPIRAASACCTHLTNATQYSPPSHHIDLYQVDVDDDDADDDDDDAGWVPSVRQLLSPDFCRTQLEVTSVLCQQPCFSKRRRWWWLWLRCWWWQRWWWWLQWWWWWGWLGGGGFLSSNNLKSHLYGVNAAD